MSKRSHRCVVVDRGRGHIHRFTPSCVCGWFGHHRRTRRAARDEYRDHINGQQVRTQRPDRRGPGPRPCTPLEQLPPELR